MIVVAGIDPGLSGAMAAFEIDARPFVERPERRAVHIADMPTHEFDGHNEIDAGKLNDWLQEHQPEHIFLERVNAMPSIPNSFGIRRSMGATSAFSFGASTGIIKATIALYGLIPRMVAPASWKKRFGLRGPSKEQSRQAALRLMPDSAFYLTRKKDSGRAESLLLAMYGAEIILGELRMQSIVAQTSLTTSTMKSYGTLSARRIR